MQSGWLFWSRSVNLPRRPFILTLDILHAAGCFAATAAPNLVLATAAFAVIGATATVSSR